MKKFIYSIVISGLTVFVSSQFPAQAQETPQFCQINAGNVSQYTSQNNPFGPQAASTPYRPFLTNNQTYNINQELIAKPLYYAALSDGILVAFQLQGKYGNLTIGENDVVVENVVYYPMNSSFRVGSFCVNGVLTPAMGQKTFSTNILPVRSFDALEEASLGVTTDQTTNLFR